MTLASRLSCISTSVRTKADVPLLSLNQARGEGKGIEMPSKYARVAQRKTEWSFLTLSWQRAALECLVVCRECIRVMEERPKKKNDGTAAGMCTGVGHWRDCFRAPHRQRLGKAPRRPGGIQHSQEKLEADMLQFCVSIRKTWTKHSFFFFFQIGVLRFD